MSPPKETDAWGNSVTESIKRELYHGKARVHLHLGGPKWVATSSRIKGTSERLERESREPLSRLYSLKRLQSAAVCCNLRNIIQAGDIVEKQY
ncbi:hypothetical protein RRG08_051037 [Elysia crispata]|uniref:Uncharacterized protein n=1 Tax=Elysia crispata TaxID=231223 RepID=A0AAE1D9X1_9GAST|nr:hypothetical protein RRG08_051037 [Elysia crispata]